MDNQFSMSRIMLGCSAGGWAQILPIRRYKSFDPDATWAMGAAYDKAIDTVHSDAESQLVIRKLIAKRIIQLAQ
jgi:hypothetical protein